MSKAGKKETQDRNQTEGAKDTGAKTEKKGILGKLKAMIGMGG